MIKKRIRSAIESSVPDVLPEVLQYMEGTNDEPYIDTSTNQYIGVNAAKEIALAHAGLKTGDISKLEVELEKENGLMIYEVEFKYSGYEYEYEINAVTGKILEWERERD